MLFLIAAAAVIPPLPAAHSPTSATAQARAIVRIVSGVRLRFSGEQDQGVPRLRETKVRTADARLQPARLIEFE
jgi:hypothetical protein